MTEAGEVIRSRSFCNSMSRRMPSSKRPGVVCWPLSTERYTSASNLPSPLRKAAMDSMERRSSAGATESPMRAASSASRRSVIMACNTWRLRPICFMSSALMPG